jgi:hypothetical protein
MRIRGALALGAVALLTLSAAACGDDDDDKGGDAATTTAASTSGSSGGSSGGDASSATEQHYVAAIEAQFTNGGADSLQMTDEQAACVAPKWLDVIGVDRLKEKGVTPDDIRADTDNEKLSTLSLGDDDATKMYDAYGECDVDVRAQFARSFAASAELPDDVEECVGDAVSDDLMQRLFVTSVTKGQAGLDADDQLTTDLTAALGKCAPTTTTG